MALDIRLKLSGNVKLKYKTLCASRFQKGRICNTSRTPNDVLLKLSGNVERTFKLKQKTLCECKFVCGDVPQRADLRYIRKG